MPVSGGPRDCASERKLSAAGREDARAIGRALKALGVPVGQVLASPTCRTDETAKLIFGRTEPSPDVRGGGLGHPSYPGLRKLLSTPVPAGANRAIVGHGSQFETEAGPPELEWSEMALIKPTGTDFKLVARVRVEAWSGVVSAVKAP